MLSDLDAALAISNIVITRLYDPDARMNDVYKTLRISSSELNEWCKNTFGWNTSRVTNTLSYGAHVSIPNMRIFSGFLEVDPVAIKRRLNPFGSETNTVIVRDNTALVCTNGDIFVSVTKDTFKDYHDLWIKNGSELCTNVDGKYSNKLYINSNVAENAVVETILNTTACRAREINRDKPRARN